MPIRLTLTHMAHGGEAIGRHRGKVVFVPYGLPGEEVELVEERRSYARGRLVRIIKSSPGRVNPPCPHFGPCGGSQGQHASYAAQLRFKEEILRDQLRRIARIQAPPLRPCIGMQEPWRYRNHVQLARSNSTSKERVASPSASGRAPVSVCSSSSCRGWSCLPGNRRAYGLRARF
ncbi:MAG: class I SAM-dependent RNA methyltransferase [Chloroflexi bacterium]|nr:class I SAM-dependent RNA methyltransferase [Chloroflexota bacterium]